MQISTTAKARALMLAAAGATSLFSSDASASGSAEAPDRTATVIEQALLEPVLHRFSAGSIRTTGRFRNVRLDLAYDVKLRDRWSVLLGFGTRIVTPQAPTSLRERGLAGSVAMVVRF